MIKDLMKILTFTMLTLVFVQNVHGECRLNNMRVNYIANSDKGTFVGFENLEDKVGLYFEKDVSDPKSLDLLAFLKRASKSKNHYFDVALEDYACDRIEQNKGESISYFSANTALTYASSDDDFGCLCNITNSSTPTMFMLPTMNEMDLILRKMTGLSDAQVNNFKVGMLQMFKDMNPQRPEANSIALPLILIEKLKLLGVKKVTNEQLSYLVGIFSDHLNPDELGLLEDIIDQVKEIEFSEDAKGNTVAKLHTYQNDIRITAQDIPTENAAQKEILEETLHHATIENGAKLVYTESDGERGLEKEVDIRGIEILGTFPVIGKLKVSPRRAKIDLTDDDVPARVKVKMKKGISLYWTFDIKY